LFFYLWFYAPSKILLDTWTALKLLQFKFEFIFIIEVLYYLSSQFELNCLPICIEVLYSVGLCWGCCLTELVVLLLLDVDIVCDFESALLFVLAGLDCNHSQMLS
jgi:hypothetical protein